MHQKASRTLRVLGFKVLGFKVLGFQVLGFRVLGFRVLGFKVLGFRVSFTLPTKVSLLLIRQPLVREPKRDSMLDKVPYITTRAYVIASPFQAPQIST